MGWSRICADLLGFAQIRPGPVGFGRVRPGVAAAGFTGSPSAPPPPHPMASSSSSGELVLLHGDLDLNIAEARNLPNLDLFSEHLSRCFSACSPPLRRSLDGSRRHRKVITSDPYVSVRVAGAIVARTRVIPNSPDPVWRERFRIPLAHRTAALEFVLKDNDVFGVQLIGTATIPASRVASGEPLQEVWLPVLGPSGQPAMPDAKLLVTLTFVPVDKNPAYRHGITGDPESRGVRDAYFPLRKGGMVTLYQDAHVGDGDLPEIELDGGRVFRQEHCWEDICQSILEARHLIYIVGWSVNHKVRLVRGESKRQLLKAAELTLGELLKYKSEEGVRVCLLVWDDKTSNDRLFKTSGMMQTHDEETKKFFKHSSVICVLSPRYPSSKLSIIKQQIVGTIYTHHQKCVIVDTEAFQGTRKITAFIGGIDLCDGRYDTPKHRLFDGLDTVFRDDFHNPILDAQTKGPREPWHDLHCRIEGPAAYDVLLNFEQRWRRATKFWSFGRGFRRTTHWRDDALIMIDRISWIISPSNTDPDGNSNVWVSREEDSDTWHVQVFRSIDSGSVKGFPKSIHEAEEKSLVCGKNLVIDKSIHTAYVSAIRSAKHFIYIENQYFIGSSYGWPSYENAGAENLIPMELALKISQKIRERERFAVYIIVPMWPEGNPNSPSVQEILFWQGQTMEMMYRIIGQQLKSMNLENTHPQDYLNFYCLGNRELNDGMQFSDPPTENNATAMAQKYQRFMVYVHGKGMIVDDEYVILGSANINQRSLDGSRDTEIAMGAYQPHHTWVSKGSHPHGQVYGYRMSLWAEHLGQLDSPHFKEPHKLECVKLVNDRAEENWTRYTAEAVKPLRGHLLKYPIKVEADGTVGPLPGHTTFPDVGGEVLGRPTPLPDELTV